MIVLCHGELIVVPCVGWRDPHRCLETEPSEVTAQHFVSGCGQALPEVVPLPVPTEFASVVSESHFPAVFWLVAALVVIALGAGWLFLRNQAPVVMAAFIPTTTPLPPTITMTPTWTPLPSETLPPSETPGPT